MSEFIGEWSSGEDEDAYENGRGVQMVKRDATIAYWQQQRQQEKISDE